MRCSCGLSVKKGTDLTNPDQPMGMHKQGRLCYLRAGSGSGHYLGWARTVPRPYNESGGKMPPLRAYGRKHGGSRYGMAGWKPTLLVPSHPTLNLHLQLILPQPFPFTRTSKPRAAWLPIRLLQHLTYLRPPGYRASHQSGSRFPRLPGPAATLQPYPRA